MKEFKDIVIYKDQQKQVEVIIEKESIWLDAHKIAQIFNVQRPAIVKHINNIYKSGELKKITNI